MPTYEYRCSDCGHRFETHRGIDDQPLLVCERCGGRLRKVFHPAGIVFKGSGFYATDSRSKKAESKEVRDAKQSDTKASEAKEADSSGGSKSDGTGDKGSSKADTSTTKKADGPESSS